MQNYSQTFQVEEITQDSLSAPFTVHLCQMTKDICHLFFIRVTHFLWFDWSHFWSYRRFWYLECYLKLKEMEQIDTKCYCSKRYVMYLWYHILTSASLVVAFLICTVSLAIWKARGPICTSTNTREKERISGDLITAGSWNTPVTDMTVQNSWKERKRKTHLKRLFLDNKLLKQTSCFTTHNT